MAVGQGAAYLNARFAPPHVGTDKVVGRGDEDLAGAFVHAFAASPTHALEGKAGAVRCLLGEAGDQRIDVARPLAQRHSSIRESLIGAVDAPQHAPRGAEVAGPQQAVEAARAVLGGKKSAVVAPQGLLLGARQVVFQPHAAQQRRALIGPPGAQMDTAEDDAALGAEHRPACRPREDLGVVEVVAGERAFRVTPKRPAPRPVGVGVDERRDLGK